MKNRKPALALLLLLSLSLLLSACGAKGMASGEANYAPQASFPAEAPALADAPGAGGPSADGAYNGAYAEEAFPSSPGGAYYENTKIIRTADLSLQSTDFDGAVAALDALVSAQNGYYESSDFTYGSYSGGGNRWASFTIRVPKENFDPFLNAVGDVAHVVSRNTGVQDVGEAYYDAELHLATLNTKYDRLLALLEKAEIMEDIIALESALSEVEYQIQQYKSTLTRYDGLIDFSTITVNLREVVRVTETSTEADPLHVRMGAAFTRGWHNFCDGLADFAVWAAYNFFGLLVFLVLLAAAVTVFLRLRKRRSRREKTPEPPEDNSQN